MDAATHRLCIERIPPRRGTSFADEVRAGLSASPKTLPSRFFYDERGSRLFERITELPEYYLTRCEQSILDACAPEIVATAGMRVSIVEFGSGSSTKTRTLLEAALAGGAEVLYSPIDISETFLHETAVRLLADFPRLRIHGLAAEYHDALSELPSADAPRLFLFLGSNIGNFENGEALAFLREVRACMRAEDRLLVGIDLYKDAAIVEPAYNDAGGVTEAFNKNVLRRIDDELGGRFDLDAFRHHAPLVPEHSRIEMRLISKFDQTVPIDALNWSVDFARDEPIRTEVSTKYTIPAFEALAREAGLAPVARWLEEREWFAEVLLAPEAP